jgi:hypothetical protein
MSHVEFVTFRSSEAQKHGVEKAILLENIRFNQSRNYNNKVFEFDGHTWAYAKLGALENMYPFMSTSSISRWLRELENDGVIVSEKFMSRGWNHTKFYRVVGFMDKPEDKVEEEEVEYENSNSQNGKSNSQNGISKNAQNGKSSIYYLLNSYNIYRESQDSLRTPFQFDDVPFEEKKPAIASVNDWKIAVEMSLRLLYRIIEYDSEDSYAKTYPDIRNWAIEIEKAIRKHKRTREQILYLIDYIYLRDTKVADFWRSNFRSGKKVYTHFDKIKNQIKSEVKPKQSQNYETKGDRAVNILES